MVPYIKKIVELHKIHKAIENRNGGGDGGGDTPSGEVTIDDVVKFMHDTIDDAGYGEMFPYETWDEIPDITNAAANTIGKSTTDSAFIGDVFLNIPGYIIGTAKSI